MLKQMISAIMARHDPSVATFNDAKTIYLAYVAKLQKQLHGYVPEVWPAAVEDAELVNAERLFRRAASLAHERRRLDCVAIAQYQLGILFHLQGRLDEANEILESACRYFEGALRVDSSLVSNCHYHLGQIANLRGQGRIARHHLQIALKIDEEARDFDGSQLCRRALSKCSDDCPDANGDDRDTSIEHDSKLNANADLSLSLYECDSPDQAILMSARTSSTSDEGVERTNDQRLDEQYLTSESNQAEVVWIISDSVAANDRFRQRFEQAMQGPASSRVVVQWTAFADATTRWLPELLGHEEHLCAVVLIMEASGFVKRAYSFWVQCCIRWNGRADDFRLYVAAEDSIPLRTFEGHSAMGDRLVADLLNSVHMASSDSQATDVMAGSPEAVAASLTRFVRELETIRFNARWRRMQYVASVVAGSLGSVGQLVAIVVLFIAGWVTWQTTVQDIATHWLVSHAELMALCSGVALCFFQSVPAYVVLRGFKQTTAERNSALEWPLFVCSAAIAGIVFLVHWHQWMISWVLLGISAGMLMEFSRRKAIRAKRRGIDLQSVKEGIGSADSGPRFAHEVLAGDVAAESPFRTPLFSSDEPRTFISYAHHAPWSESKAKELHDRLSTHKSTVFFDRAEIELGESWRAALSKHLEDTDIFVSIVDEEGMRREWVAAELAVAIRSRFRTGGPQIALLVPPQRDANDKTSRLPIFNAVVEGASGVIPKQSSIRIIYANDDGIQHLADALQPDRHWTPAIYPPELCFVLEVLAFPIIVLGTLGSVIGVPAGLLALLELSHITDLAGQLSSWRAFTWTYLLLAYWTGFTACEFSGLAYEARRQTVRVAASKRGLAVLGFCCLLREWSRYTDYYIVGWSIVLACFAWCLCGRFIQRVVYVSACAGRLR